MPSGAGVAPSAVDPASLPLLSSSSFLTGAPKLPLPPDAKENPVEGAPKLKPDLGADDSVVLSEKLEAEEDEDPKEKPVLELALGLEPKAPNPNADPAAGALSSFLSSDLPKPPKALFGASVGGLEAVEDDDDDPPNENGSDEIGAVDEFELAGLLKENGNEEGAEEVPDPKIELLELGGAPNVNELDEEAEEAGFEDSLLPPKENPPERGAGLVVSEEGSAALPKEPKLVAGAGAALVAGGEDSGALPKEPNPLKLAGGAGIPGSLGGGELVVDVDAAEVEPNEPNPLKAAGAAGIVGLGASAGFGASAAFGGDGVGWEALFLSKLSCDSFLYFL